MGIVTGLTGLIARHAGEIGVLWVFANTTALMLGLHRTRKGA